MRITIVQGAFLPVPPLMGGAVEKVWFALGKEFVRRGHEVCHVSRRYRKLPKREIIDGVQHTRVSGFSTRSSLVLLKLLDLFYSLRVLSTLPEADILVSNTFWLPILVNKPSLGRLYIHVGRFPKGQMRFYSQAARLQTVSSAIADAITAEVPRLADSVRVIPYPLGDETDGISMDEIPREKLLLYVGRVHREKGLHLLIRAFSAVAKMAMKGWRLVIVGPAEVEFGGGGSKYLQELKRLAEPVADQIDWVGPLFETKRLADYYRRASLFVYPSLAERGETFGLAPLEAMSHGCAPLVSNLACFRDHVSDGVTGFIFEQRSAEAERTLASRLAELAQNESILAVVGASARRKSCDYRLATIADRYLRDFESILNQEC